MSPGSSSHSSVGAKSREDLQRHVVAQARARRRGRCASACGPRPAAGRRRSESMCGPTPPPSVANENITSSRRASATKRKRRSSRCARSSAGRRPAPAASTPASSAPAARAARTGRGAATSASPSRTTRRDSTSSSRGQREQLRRGRRAASASAHRGADQQRLLLPVPAHELARPKGRRAGPWGRSMSMHSLCDHRFDADRRLPASSA